jgi:CelD/BcsL family acetyltransferase involved in cellulose biosynthesis
MVTAAGVPALQTMAGSSDIALRVPQATMVPGGGQGLHALSADWLGYEEFCRAASAWDELLSATARPTPFSTHVWLRTWWRHFGADQDFQALVVREGGRWVCAVPLGVRSVRAAGRRLTIGEIVGTAAVPTRGMGLSDKADLLVREEDRPASERLVAELMRRLDSIDVLHLKGLDSTAASWTALVDATAGRPAAWRLVRSQSPYLALEGTWESYLDSRSRRLRKNLRRCRRMLEEEGPVAISRTGDPRSPATVADLLRISGESGTSRRGTDLFRHPAIRAFLVDVLREMEAAGALDLHVLRVGGEPIGYELCFDVGGRIFGYNAGYREDYARASPGNLVTIAVIESAYSRGRSEYDMLRGTEAYKLRWSETLRTEQQLVVAAERLPARVYAQAALCLKERLRQTGWLDEIDDRLSGLLNRVRFR